MISSRLTSLTLAASISCPAEASSCAEPDAIEMEMLETRFADNDGVASADQLRSISAPPTALAACLRAGPEARGNATSLPHPLDYARADRRRGRGRLMDILRAIGDPKVFGSHFRDKRGSWQAGSRSWLPCSALALTPEHGLPSTSNVLAAARRPEGSAREAWLVCGRRAGKSFILALVAVFLASFHDWRPISVLASAAPSWSSPPTGGRRAPSCATSRACSKLGTRCWRS